MDEFHRPSIVATGAIQRIGTPVRQAPESEKQENKISCAICKYMVENWIMVVFRKYMAGPSFPLVEERYNALEKPNAKPRYPFDSIKTDHHPHFDIRILKFGIRRLDRCRQFIKVVSKPSIGFNVKAEHGGRKQEYITYFEDWTPRSNTGSGPAGRS